MLTLRRHDFWQGPVIAINYAIHRIRTLALEGPVYSLQQDGCLVDPIEPETILLSADYGMGCFPNYPRRIVFDVQRDLGLPFTGMSTPIAVKIAHLMGASELMMMGHDAYVHGDRRLVDGNTVIDGSISFPGYVQGAEIAEEIASAAGIRIEWL